MGLLALIAVLNARKFLVVSAVVISALIALVAGVIAPTEYKSTARIQVDSRQKNPLTGLFEPRLRVIEFLGQQAAVAGSRNVALQVYDTLVAEGVFIVSDLETEWRLQTGGEVVSGNDARLWAADQMLRKLVVEPNENAGTITISFRSESASEASRITNAFASAYMRTVLNQRQRRAARNAVNFSEETDALELDMEAAQRELTVFRETSGIVALGAQRLEGEEVGLASVTMRLAEARADLSEAQSLLRQARAASDIELLTLPLPQDAHAGRQSQSRLGVVLVQLQRISERYGEQYPDYIEAVNEKRALEATIMRAVVNRAEYAARRVASLNASVDDQKRTVVNLQETKQQFDVLEKKVDASRDTYDLVATRSLQEALQSRVDSVELFLLARAVPAEHPTTPPLPIIILIGIFAGLGLGGAAAVTVELVEGRIRGEDALAQLLRAPVLAKLTVPATSGGAQ